MSAIRVFDRKHDAYCSLRQEGEPNNMTDEEINRLVESWEERNEGNRVEYYVDDDRRHWYVFLSANGDSFKGMAYLDGFLAAILTPDGLRIDGR